MKLSQTIFVVVPVVAFALAKPALAKPSARVVPCEQGVQRAASHLIFDLSLDLERKNALSSDEFSKIRASLDALEANINSPTARRCFEQEPRQRQRYLQWKREQAGALVRRAEQRLEQVCARQSTIFINERQLRIERTLAKKRLAKAARDASTLAERLRTDPMISRCDATRRQVQELLQTYIPGIQNRAAIPRLREQMNRAYAAAKSSVESGLRALGTSGRGMKAVSPSLESEAGQTLLRKQLEQCRSYARELFELGAGADVSLAQADGSSTPLGAARAFCEDTQARLPALLARFATHNTAYRSAQLSRWLRRSIKGWGMEKVYNAKGRPLVESADASGHVLWTYAGDDTPSSCLQIRFSSRGKKVGQRRVPCPATAARR